MTDKPPHPISAAAGPSVGSAAPRSAASSKDAPGSSRPPRSDTESHTDDLDLSGLREVGLTQTYSTGDGPGGAGYQPALEANVILIAHPEAKRLGSRFRLGLGQNLEIGRDPEVAISLPEVLSISRRHALLRYNGRVVTLEDLGSTNGTYINGEMIRGRRVLESGDRFQVAAVHFKFLREQDVENAYYHAISDLVTRDGLTDVYNKRTFDEEIEREWARSVRYGRDLSLIVIDVDNFKEVNDSYGHLCGDFVLKQVTNIARQQLRPEQMLARVGGDEFVILCPETDVEGAATLAEKIRERIAGLAYTYCEIRVEVSCSFGVAGRRDAMSHPEDLYRAADEALFTSKRRGRNRVALAETDPA